MNSVLLGISVVVQLAAVAWSIVVWRRLRDWRFAALPLLVVLVSMSRPLAPAGDLETQGASALLQSLLALLAVVLLGRVLEAHGAARRAMAARHRALAENAPQTVYATDMEGVFTAVSRRGEELTGHSREELRRMRLADLATRATADRCREMLRRAATGSEQVTICEAELATASGREVPVEFRSWLVHGDDGRRTIEGICSDLSEETRLRRELEEAERSLRQTEKLWALGSLASAVAHDFNNHLYAIQLHTELALARVPAASPLVRHLQEILSSVQLGSALAQQVVTLSRTDEPPEVHAISLTSAVESLAAVLRLMLPSSIELDYELRPCPDTVDADPGTLKQLILNLCATAAQACARSGRVEIAVNASEADPETLSAHAAFVGLTVRGVGRAARRSDPQQAEPFRSGGAGTRRPDLEVFVVRRIAKRLRGRLRVAPHPEGGMVFSVSLPRSEREASWPSARSSTADRLERGTETILLVDDEPPVLDAEREMLEFLGYQVVAFSSAEEALSIFRRAPERFDLVLTDQSMPRLSGAALAREILATRRDVPVIVATGYSTSLDEATARRLGIACLLEKPVSLRSCAHIVRRALDGTANRY